ncbi:MAG: prolyl oligopeptidase family serine peptidase [Phycisphaerales bacterium JB060]
MRILITFFVVLVCSRSILGQAVVDLPVDAELLVVREVLALDRLSRGGRSLIVSDPVELSLVRGDWKPPAEGDEVTTPDGRSASWKPLSANDEGVFNDRALAGGYAHVVIRSPQRRIAMLHARGHRHVMVNGQRRGGDVYNLGITALPIELREGDNELLFKGGRGRMRIELREPEAELFWLDSDVTKPDFLITNEMRSLPIAAPLVNATTRQLLGVKGEWAGPWTATSEVTGNGAIAPLGVRKLPVYAASDRKPEGEEASVRIRAGSASGNAATTVTLPVRTLNDKHSRTFISDIDGSVQYYAVTPPAEGTQPQSFILTLHGASVEARNQANAYGHKDGTIIVAPTNRRPFGFDWEDWGRLDAIEVLAHARDAYGHENAERTYLTGHSMGGHGTWQVGAHFAPKFAAIGPSAGWRDFWSYGGAGEFDEGDPIGQILNTANNASRTLLLEENYADLGVYVLHGDADNNVPVSQARFMRECLAKFHPDFAYYERPGAGHWWGNQCVDWPPMMRFFEDRAIDMTPARERFTTINPAISSEARLFTIQRQARSMEPATLAVVRPTAEAPMDITTSNVLAFSLDHEVIDGEHFRDTVMIDGQEVHRMGGGILYDFERATLDDPWKAIAPLHDPALKGAHRAGPFKHAFDNNMAFVYATGGTEEENAWALAKARYDADTWQYRANGSVDVVPDTAFDPDADVNAGRNVILYGCADSHRLWDELLGDAPVRIGRGSAMVGDRTIERDDVAAFFAYPRAGTDDALVGVVAGTGPVGRRLADEPRYFISGVGYPDWLLMTPDVLDSGAEGGLEGVIGAGFFGPDWSVDPAQSAWR